MTPAEQCLQALKAITESSTRPYPDDKALEILQKALEEAVNATKDKSEQSVHTLKSWPDAYQPLVEGRKRHEYRLNDRNYREGDELILKEWDPAGHSYTGRSCRVRCLYCSYGPSWGIPEGHAVISISDPYDIRDPET